MNNQIDTKEKDRNKAQNKESVRVHIDHDAYMSPVDTTGTALYKLGNVASGHQLFREAQGNQEDELIPNDDTAVHLKEGEHFYSQLDYAIVVNARQKIVTDRILAFEQVVVLAFGTMETNPNILYTITYRKGPRQNPQGHLVAGQSVVIKNGMVFNVVRTDKS